MQSLLHDNQVDFETLVNGDWMEEVRARGNMRMLESIKHDEGVNVATRQDIHTEYGQMIEGLGFYYAMFVVCASFDERLMKRWIEGEASRADSLLGSSVDGETFDLVARTYLSALRQQQKENNATPIHTTRAPPNCSRFQWSTSSNSHHASRAHIGASQTAHFGMVG